MKTPAILFILAIFLLSCSKEIDFKNNNVENKLVLNGLISPDSLIWVHLSRTTSIVSNEIQAIENATVSLYCNGRYIETLPYSKNGIYKSKAAFPISRQYLYHRSKSRRLPRPLPLPIQSRAEQGLYMAPILQEIHTTNMATPIMTMKLPLATPLKKIFTNCFL